MKNEKFVPFEKLSKKKQRELNAQKRCGWGDISPVTRKAESKKAYNRKKLRGKDSAELYLLMNICFELCSEFGIFQRQSDRQRVLIYS